MRELIRTQADSRVTIFLSSHPLHEVEQICDRVAILNQGRVIALDSVQALLIGIIGRSTVMALGGSIGFLILEMITRQFLICFGQVGVLVTKRFLISLSMSMLRPSQQIANVIPHGTAGTDLWTSLQLASLPVASIVIALYVGLCLVFAGWLFSKQDLTG